MEFTFNQFFWQSNVQLSEWSDFITENPTVLTFAPEGRGEAPLSADEIALANWVLDNYAIQKPKILNAILGSYPEFRRQYFEDYDITENENDLPTITSLDDLPKVIALEGVNVHQISKNSVPYVGYEFSCDWDQEHGLGVLMHDCRVVEINGADTAFLLWIAERDRDS